MTSPMCRGMIIEKHHTADVQLSGLLCRDGTKFQISVNSLLIKHVIHNTSSAHIYLKRGERD